MNRKTWLIALGIVAAIAGVFVLYDVLVETDEERLEAFIPDVSGAISEAKLDGAITRWVDLDRQTIEVSALGQAQAYGAGEEQALRTDAANRLRSLYGTNARVISSGIVVEGDSATITLRLMNDQLGMQTAEWTLERHDGDWLVARLGVHR